MHLNAGQNALLTGTVWDFTVDAPAMTLYGVIMDEHKRASPGTPVARGSGEQVAVLEGDGWVHIDLNRVPDSVTRILCAADCGSEEQRPSATTQVVAKLTNCDGATFEFAIAPANLHPAMICLEVYRRGGRWKVRAVGQGYAGGRSELLGSYGLAAPEPPTAQASELPPSNMTPLEDTDPLERMRMIFEDAARTTAGFASARDYAAIRLHEDLSIAIADPATRNSEFARRAAAEAHARHDDLVARARVGYDSDATYLQAELQQLDRVLPPSMASWRSPSWHTADATMSAGAGAVRLGEVLAQDIGELRVPFCVPAPLRQPVWISSTDADAASPIVAALVVRLLAATPSPAPVLDVVDLTGGLQELTTNLASFMLRPAVSNHRNLAAALEQLATDIDLAALTAAADNRQAAASIVVLSDFGFGFGHDALGPLSTLVSMVAAGRLSIVIVGESPGTQTLVEPVVGQLYPLCQVIPAGRDGVFVDPWTEREWRFHADVLAGDWQHPLSLLAQLTPR